VAGMHFSADPAEALGHNVQARWLRPALYFECETPAHSALQSGARAASRLACAARSVEIASAVATRSILFFARAAPVKHSDIAQLRARLRDAKRQRPRCCGAEPNRNNTATRC
jgi:hypothetical protein